MRILVRQVLPELLDSLDPDDPRAMRSRRDLQRVHRAMRSLSILKRAIGRLQLASAPRRILELGAGDATLLLRLARSQPHWAPVSLTVLDTQDLVSNTTRAAYRSLGWELHVIRQDVMQWAREPGTLHHDLCIANLFLHHFGGPALATLLQAIARDCDALVACEPRRNSIALLGSRVIGLLGASHVTRQDAVTSVIAGFSGRELSALWPAQAPGWHCEEYGALPFTHCLAAVRDSARSAAGSR